MRTIRSPFADNPEFATPEEEDAFVSSIRELLAEAGWRFFDHREMTGEAIEQWDEMISAQGLVLETYDTEADYFAFRIVLN